VDHLRGGQPHRRDRRRVCPASSLNVLAVLLGIWFIIMGIFEIIGGLAEQMFLSPNATSIYRKLGVSSRSQAISRSVELGLLTG